MLPIGAIRRIERHTVLLLAVVLAFAAALPLGGRAWAGLYATSRSPHWDVGALDPALSNACRRGRFNQLVDRSVYIAYLGEQGYGTTGAARKGWNLRDPEHLAAASTTYHFVDDGFSTCRVFTAADAPPANQAPPTPPAK